MTKHLSRKAKLKLKKNLRRRDYEATIFNKFGRRPIIKVNHIEVKKYYQYTYKWRNGFNTEKNESYQNLLFNLRMFPGLKNVKDFMDWIEKELV